MHGHYQMLRSWAPLLLTMRFAAVPPCALSSTLLQALPFVCLSFGLLSSPSSSYPRVCEQVGFFEVVGLPLFQSMATVVPGAHVLLEATTANYTLWRHESDNP